MAPLPGRIPGHHDPGGSHSLTPAPAEPAGVDDRCQSPDAVLGIVDRSGPAVVYPGCLCLAHRPLPETGGGRFLAVPLFPASPVPGLDPLELRHAHLPHQPAQHETFLGNRREPGLAPVHHDHHRGLPAGGNPDETGLRGNLPGLPGTDPFPVSAAKVDRQEPVLARTCAVRRRLSEAQTGSGVDHRALHRRPDRPVLSGQNATAPIHPGHCVRSTGGKIHRRGTGPTGSGIPSPLPGPVFPGHPAP